MMDEFSLCHNAISFLDNGEITKLILMLDEKVKNGNIEDNTGFIKNSISNIQNTGINKANITSIRGTINHNLFYLVDRTIIDDIYSQNLESTKAAKMIAKEIRNILI